MRYPLDLVFPGPVFPAKWFVLVAICNNRDTINISDELFLSVIEFVMIRLAEIPTFSVDGAFIKVRRPITCRYQGVTIF
jgi:hypothetical protein